MLPAINSSGVQNSDFPISEAKEQKKTFAFTHGRLYDRPFGGMDEKF